MKRTLISPHCCVDIFFLPLVDVNEGRKDGLNSLVHKSTDNTELEHFIISEATRLAKNCVGEMILCFEVMIWLE